MNNDMGNNSNLEVNKKNSEDYDNLMKQSSTDVDRYYWDRKNPAVMIILLVLLVIIVIGAIGIFIWAGFF